MPGGDHFSGSTGNFLALAWDVSYNGAGKRVAAELPDALGRSPRSGLGVAVLLADTAVLSDGPAASEGGAAVWPGSRPSALPEQRRPAPQNRRGKIKRGEGMNRELWEKAVTFHGHICPGLAIGFKACEAAMEKMSIGASEDEEIVCVTENDACGVDAVQAILSCTLGKGNLVYRGTGKQAFAFFNRKTGEKLRVYLKAQNLGMDRDAWREYLLQAPCDELFAFSEPAFELPEPARRLATVYCSKCGEGAPEHKIHLEQGVPVCEDCVSPYGRGW